MSTILIKNANIVNEGQIFQGNIFIENDIIKKISVLPVDYNADELIDAKGMYLLPGIIDDQVHFREPGLTHKGDIYSESRAAAAGGITSFMEMPNTVPQTTTQEELSKKFHLASKKSLVNYSFYLGATNDNLKEILKSDPSKVCGIKVFMGSSTGNMLVDKIQSLENIFRESPLLIATHCEEEGTIKRNTELYRSKYGEQLPFRYHPVIRDSEACYKSSSLAVELADKFNSKLHILHLSTEKELSLFKKGEIADKRITAEVCVHHLWFNESDYDKYGSLIKWNPAVKAETDRQALLNAIKDDRLDVVATDHAPHTLEEKSSFYFRAPSGGPLIQHSLLVMLEFYHKGIFTLEQIVTKMCHNPADLFQIKERGFIREGYKADLVLVDINKITQVKKDNILYKCGWSPFEGYTFQSEIISTFVNGSVVYNNGQIFENNVAEALEFNR